LPRNHEPVTKPDSSTPKYIIIALLALIAGGGAVALLRPNRVETVSLPANASSPLPVNDLNNANTERIVPAGKSASSKATPISPPTDGTWFVVLGSFPRSEREKADQRLQSIQGSGYQASLIDTDNYPGLRSGLWAVVLGPYSKAGAKSVVDQVKVVRRDAYVKSGW